MMETVRELVGKVQEIVPGMAGEIPKAVNGALEILIVGSPQENLLGLMNEIVGGLDPLDYPMMSGYRGTIVYGDNRAVFLTDQVSPVASDMESLSDKLKKYNKNSLQHRFTIVHDNEMLKNCTIHVLASDSDFEDVNWNAELSGCDYFFLAMSSTSLLSMAERKAIRNWLMPYASGAYGILLTNDNMILEDDRKDIDASLENMFHGDVSVFRFPETDTADLVKLFDSLKENVPDWHERTAGRAERLVLINAREAVELQIKVFSENKSGVEKIIEAVRDSAQKLPGRQKAAFRYARMQYIAAAKLDAVQRVNDFHKELDGRLKGEILQGGDPGDMLEILPSYIADAWRSCADAIFDNIQVQTTAMQKDLQIYIEKDIRNYIEGCMEEGSADYIYALTEKYFKLKDSFEIHDEDNQFLYDAPKDNTKAKYYGVIASGIALVLFSHPIIGVAVATLGAKKIKQSSEQQVEQETRQALILSCEELNREYSDDMGVWIDSIFDSVEKNIEASIDECYQKMIDNIIKALNMRMTDQNDYEEKIGELMTLKDEIDARLTV